MLSLTRRGLRVLVPSYKPLWDLLDARGMPHKDLLRFISPVALKKLQHAEAVSMTIIGKLCEGLDVPINRIVEMVKPVE